MERRNFLLGSVTSVLTGLIGGITQISDKVPVLLTKGNYNFAKLRSVYCSQEALEGIQNWNVSEIDNKAVQYDMDNMNFTFITDNNGNIKEVFNV